MTTTSESHGENMALSGLTEPTTQPELSLPACENRPDLSDMVKDRDGLPSWEKMNSLQMDASSSAALQNAPGRLFCSQPVIPLSS